MPSTRAGLIEASHWLGSPSHIVKARQDHRAMVKARQDHRAMVKARQDHKAMVKARQDHRAMVKARQGWGWAPGSRAHLIEFAD